MKYSIFIDKLRWYRVFDALKPPFFVGGNMNVVDLENILSVALEEIKCVDVSKGMDEITNLRNKYLSKKSELMSCMSLLGKMEVEERKTFGAKVNEVRTIITKSIEDKTKEIQDYLLKEKLKKEDIDITLPSKNFTLGSVNPFYKVKNEMVKIFVEMGYEVVDGPEVEIDKNNFELLNIPFDHPARDMQDSFYIDENTLLRTHTSAIQARVMQARGGQPVKIICPGKTYRRDDDDATHSHQFSQIEGLLIDKNITMANLKATLELFLKRLFGENREIRLRSSYFPFTEPSVEIDISCASCGGKGCSMCKGSGYIEILGGGMVHPNVLKLNGYDPEEYSGFAFGVGVERLAILKYGIDDIRRFYTNDVRFLHQFKKK